MAYAVDWAIEAAPVLALVTREMRADEELPGTPGGLCVTASGSVVVSEPAADRARQIGLRGTSVVFGGARASGTALPGRPVSGALSGLPPAPTARSWLPTPTTTRSGASTPTAG